MMNKQGISTVVATSLIILITIAAVAIIWTAIIPMIRNNAPASDACMGVTANIQIVSACVNDSTGEVKVRVKQLDTEANITGLQLLVYNANNQGFNSNAAITGLAKNLEADATATTNANFINGTKIEVAPIVKDGELSKTCTPTAKVTLIDCA